MVNKYFISSINLNFRFSNYREISFERITSETYDIFLALKTKQLSLGDVADECFVEVILDIQEWNFTPIKDKK